MQKEILYKVCASKSKLVVDEYKVVGIRPSTLLYEGPYSQKVLYLTDLDVFQIDEKTTIPECNASFIWTFDKSKIDKYKIQVQDDFIRRMETLKQNYQNVIDESKLLVWNNHKVEKL